MGISFFNIKKWIKMLSGKSILHVNQGVGKIYSCNEVKGYYNDLTEKVTKGDNFHEVQIPVFPIEGGETVLFPIEIFQYGLGAYDLFLLENDKLYLDKFKLCANWAYENQQQDGSWDNFFFREPDAPYSSMAQGEGVSLLIRAYKQFNDEKYLISAKKAIQFLITPVEEGGTTKYIKDEVFFQEFTNKPTVLNGWIFTIFGVYDYLKVVNDNKVKSIYIKSIKTLTNHIKDFDNGYWSKYDIENKLTSPFYHRLHIAQLKVLYEITKEDSFKMYSELWEEYQRSWLKSKRAFIIKAYQKIIE